MALSELFFTLYASVTDVYNLMGHLYKVLAYLFLYRAIFVETVQRPQHQLLAAQRQLRSTFDAIPDLLFEIGLNGRYYAYHSPREDLLAAPPEGLIGRTVFDVLSAEAAATCVGHTQTAARCAAAACAQPASTSSRVMSGRTRCSSRLFAIEIPLTQPARR